MKISVMTDHVLCRVHDSFWPAGRPGRPEDHEDRVHVEARVAVVVNGVAVLGLFQFHQSESVVK
jgi:hypothetical protein